jgi:hypothetical protein
MDIDDSWDLSPTHPLYLSQKRDGIDEKIKQNLTDFEYVTTTTDIFANEIKPFNSNVVVLPNAIDPTAPEFTINKKKSDKIRFGFVMGSAHEEDVRLMGNFVSKLKPETLEKIQIVLCGFDIRGVRRAIDPKTGKVTESPLLPTETTWYRYENMVTNNRKIISDKYRKFLNMYVPNLEYPKYEEEHYHRCWTKDLDHYFSHFENLDVLYAPLEPKHFNYVKSQLKAIECCFSDTALIAQNYGPYTLDLTHGRNALLVDIDKNETDWTKYTEALVEDPSMITMLKDNIHNDLKDKYNLETVTRQRAEFYENIVKDKKGTNNIYEDLHNA